MCPRDTQLLGDHAASRVQSASRILCTNRSWKKRALRGRLRGTGREPRAGWVSPGPLEKQMGRVLRDADGEVYSRNWLTQLWRRESHDPGSEQCLSVQVRKPETGGRWGKSNPSLKVRPEAQTSGKKTVRSSSTFWFNLGLSPPAFGIYSVHQFKG